MLKKDDFVALLNAIPVGSSEPIHMYELAARLGVDARQLRQLIYDARLTGHLIVSNSKGYFRPDEGSEYAVGDLKDFYHSRRKSGTGTLQTIEATKEWLEKNGEEMEE